MNEKQPQSFEIIKNAVVSMSDNGAVIEDMDLRGILPPGEIIDLVEKGVIQLCEQSLKKVANFFGVTVEALSDPNTSHKEKAPEP